MTAKPAFPHAVESAKIVSNSVPRQIPGCERSRLRPRPFSQIITVQEFIELKNSSLDLVALSLESKNSIASEVFIGLRIRRSTNIF